MSTRAIEAVIDEFADMIGTGKSEMGLAALSELEAIRKAARVLAGMVTNPSERDWGEIEKAAKHIESIAKEDTHGR